MNTYTARLVRHAARRLQWAPVRTLGERHRQRVGEHLLALDDADRQLRFGHLASDERIASYVAQLDFDRDELFGVFDRQLALVALAHLAFDAARATSEFGVSVSPRVRGRGLGSQLFEHAVTHARNRGVHTMLIHLARDNDAMMNIVRKAGAAVNFEGGDGLAELALPADTLGSQIQELLAHQAGEFDYRMKLQVLRLDTMRPGAD
jgi:ribosomal protein S18 acetylase RimI-like enzyme